MEIYQESTSIIFDLANQKHTLTEDLLPSALGLAGYGVMLEDGVIMDGWLEIGRYDCEWVTWNVLSLMMENNKAVTIFTFAFIFAANDNSKKYPIMVVGVFAMKELKLIIMHL